MVCAVLSGLIASLYWPGLGGGFAFDDFPNIVDNTALRVTGTGWNEWMAAMFSSPSSELKRPLAMLSFAANHYFTGMDPMPMKVTNVTLHILNALLVFALVKQILRSVLGEDSTRQGSAFWPAFFASACWALHPINLTGVLYIVQRMEALSHTFVFFGLWLYVLGRQRLLRDGQGWGLLLIGLLPCTAIGLLAKESAALLPLYAFLLESCLFRFVTKNNRHDRNLYRLFALVLMLPALAGAAWLLPRSLSPQAFSTRNFNLVERLLTEPHVVLDYLRWTLLPDLSQLSLYHDDYPVSRSIFSPPATAVGLLGVAALLAAALYFRKRRPLLSLGLFWFLAAHSLTATFIPLELVFEHRNYFASLGVCLALTDLLLLAPFGQRHRRLSAFFASVFVLLCAGTTYFRADEWSTPLRFAQTEAAKRPESPRAVYGLGVVLVVLSEYNTNSPYTDQALTVFAKANELPGDGILPDQGALMLESRTGRPLQARWWQDMQAKLRSEPLGPQPLGALAAITRCAVRKACNFPRQSMLDTYAAALEQGPHPDVLTIYGDYVLNVLGDRETTLRLWREVVTLSPGVAQYRQNLARLLIATGRRDEARAQISEIHRLGRFGQYALIEHDLEKRLKVAEPSHDK